MSSLCTELFVCHITELTRYTEQEINIFQIPDLKEISGTTLFSFLEMVKIFILCYKRCEKRLASFIGFA